MNWGPSPKRPDMAYSVEDDTYIALYGVWTDPAEDAANVAWATDRMREMEPLASGIQLADENLGRRPARFVDATRRWPGSTSSAPPATPTASSTPWMGRLYEGLEAYLSRPVERPDEEVLAAIESGPIDPARGAAARGRRAPTRPGAHRRRDRLVHSPGRGRLRRRAHPDARGHRRAGRLVVRLAPRRPAALPRLAPAGHESNSIERPPRPGAKKHWDTVHHPVEDVGVGMAHARIEFCRPTGIGFTTDALDDPAVATIVCGYAGDDTRRMRHTPMVHVFLREGDGVVLRSRFWLGAAIRPYLPGPLAAPLGAALGNRLFRRLALPDDLPHALATHCAEEYANLAVLLPELHRRFG